MMRSNWTAADVVSAFRRGGPLCTLAGWRWEIAIQDGLAVWSPTQSLDAGVLTVPAVITPQAHDGMLIFARHAPPIFVTTPCIWEWAGASQSLRVRGPSGQPLIAELAPEEVLAIVKLPTGVRPRRRLAHAHDLSAQASVALARAGLLRPTHMATLSPEQPGAEMARGAETAPKSAEPSKTSLH